MALYNTLLYFLASRLLVQDTKRFHAYIGRKNFLFANTPLGAQASAVIYSLIETAKESGLDPFRYLTWVFETAPTLERTVEGWVTPLLPANAPSLAQLHNSFEPQR